MKIFSKIMLVIAFAMSLVSAPAIAESDGVVRIAFQVSDNNEGTFKKVMNNVSNLSKNLLAAGKEYEIEVVAYNAGLHLFREDTTSEADRVKSFTDAIPNLTLSACGNTIKGMTKQAGGKAPPIFDNVRVVPAGVVRLYELDQEGYFVIRP